VSSLSSSPGVEARGRRRLRWQRAPRRERGVSCYSLANCCKVHCVQLSGSFGWGCWAGGGVAALQLTVNMSVCCRVDWLSPGLDVCGRIACLQTNNLGQSLAFFAVHLDMDLWVSAFWIQWPMQVSRIRYNTLWYGTSCNKRYMIIIPVFILKGIQCDTWYDTWYGYD